MKYQLSPSSSVKASYNRMAQYIQLVSNTTASTPVDIWTPATNNIKPIKADQIALGYFQNFSDNTYEMSTEIYVKKLADIVDYIDGADLILNSTLEGDLLEGENRAYGLEFMLKKNKGLFTGWLSYTLARTENRIDGINKGDWYPTRFDQMHNFSLTTFYELSDRWSISANFAYISGTPTTFPTSRYEQQGYVLPYNANDDRNNVRIPDYHRLDIGATRKARVRPGRKWEGEWVFSIYNVYSRRNAFSIFFGPVENNNGTQFQSQATRLSVIGSFIPSISYNFKFNK